ncbi:MAG: cytochrome c [Methylovirgula sp.]
MTNRLLLALALLSLTVAPQIARAEAPIALKSTTVQLPDGDRDFPPGKGVEALNTNCRICHSVGMVMNQPPMSKAGWTAEVNKMIKVFKAPVPAQEVEPIVDYLTQLSAAK